MAGSKNSVSDDAQSQGSASQKKTVLKKPGSAGKSCKRKRIGVCKECVKEDECQPCMDLDADDEEPKGGSSSSVGSAEGAEAKPKKKPKLRDERKCKWNPEFKPKKKCD